MRTYHAEVTRDGTFWLIRVAEISRSTQALRYKDVPIMAGELIEIMAGLGSEDYELDVRVHLPNAVQDHLARAEVEQSRSGSTLDSVPLNWSGGPG
jgi:hypothetical protein